MTWSEERTTKSVLILSIESIASIKMRVQTEEWRRFIPGVRMYKGKMTLFYNGETLRDRDTREWLIYNEKERRSWEVIIVLPGVEIIPEWTLFDCKNVKVVIMSDTVKRIEECAFNNCFGLEFVKLSTNLEYIGEWAFRYCKSLTSIFIPPSCREIGNWAFYHCEKMFIMGVPQDTQLGAKVIDGTALIRASPFETDHWGDYANSNEVNEWIRNRHANNQFSLHRVCSSFNPSAEVIFDIVERQDLGAFKKPDNAGITASQYLSENPFTDIKEQHIIKRYMLDMMGEVVSSRV